MCSQVPAPVPIDWKQVQPNRLADVPRVRPALSVLKVKGFLSMKLRFLVVCLAFALMNLPAFAQDNPSPVSASTASTTGVGSGDVGLYVNPIGIGIRNSKPDSGPFAFLGDGATQRTFYGADFGGYVNFYHAQKYDAGIDIRDVSRDAAIAPI